MGFSTGKIVLGLLALWLMVIVMLSGPLFQSSEPNEMILTRLSRAVGELEALKLQNEELRNLLNFLKFPPELDSKKNDVIQALEIKLKAAKKIKAYSQYSARNFTRFTRTFQKDEPLIHLFHSKIEILSGLYWAGYMASVDDINDSIFEDTNLLSSKDIACGEILFATLKNVSEKVKQLFLRDARKHYIAGSKYIIEKCLEHGNLLKCFKCLHQNARFRQQSVAKMHFKLHDDSKLNPVLDYKEPSKEFEETRRRVEDGINEMWYYVKSEFKKLNKSVSTSPIASRTLSAILEDVRDRKMTILADMLKLKDLDGLGEWRSQESSDLSDVIQKRLEYLQNPKDCSSAKKLICNLNKGCGYGCQIHHAVYCFVVAYGTERTLILRSHNWRYAQKGWESVFLPLSNTCTDDSGASRAPWPGTEDTQIVDLPIIDNVRPRPPFIPLAIPKDLSDRIIRLHGNPIVWWIAQFLKYLLRPQDSMQLILQRVEEKMDFKHPVVGVHVRRTDKIGTEAAFHGIEEYMEYVEEYYMQLEKTNPTQIRRVYLATDDPNLLAESRKKFPNYVFYGDQSIAKSAAIGNRYTTESLKGVILDIHMLSKCDYLVCTFSSQVCRLAYEMMQNLHSDAFSNFHSLDDIFYFGGQNDHNQIALYNHSARTIHEIDFVKGDIIGIAGNHWDGFSKGLNRRTKKNGLYPSYKTAEKIDIVEFPTYSKADDHYS